MATIDDNGTLGEMFAELSRGARTLVQQEIQLAKTELTEKVSKARNGAGLVVGGGLIAYAGLLAIVAAVILALVAIGLPAWAAALIGGVLVAVAGYFLIRSGLAALRADELKPPQANTPRTGWRAGARAKPRRLVELELDGATFAAPGPRAPANAVCGSASSNWSRLRIAAPSPELLRRDLHCGKRLSEGPVAGVGLCGRRSATSARNAGPRRRRPRISSRTTSSSRSPGPGAPAAQSVPAPASSTPSRPTRGPAFSDPRARAAVASSASTSPVARSTRVGNRSAAETSRADRPWTTMSRTAALTGPRGVRMMLPWVETGQELRCAHQPPGRAGRRSDGSTRRLGCGPARGVRSSPRSQCRRMLQRQKEYGAMSRPCAESQSSE